MTSVPLNIPINDDNIFEDFEWFLVTINSLPTSVMFGNPDQAEVEIVDNDRKL